MPTPCEVPFLDLAREAATLPVDAILDDIRAIVRSGVFIGGAPVVGFETAFAAYCGTRFAIGCGNGLDALVLSLAALDIGPGHEVIVPAHTFLATWLAVSRTGATPVPVDVRADTGCIDPDLIAAAVSERTRAVVVVHLYGHIPDMERIGAIARSHGLAVVEDAAQAHGATRNGVRAGAFGRLAAFSFYPVKNLGAWGDAGAVTTDDPALAERIARLRDYGRTAQHDFGELGLNSRLDPVQAAVLGRKLELLDAMNDRRRAIAGHYDAAIAGRGRIRRMLGTGEESVWHQYVLLADDREGLRRHLADSGIGTAVHYPVPPHRQPCYAGLGLDGRDWPVTQRLTRQVVSLPVGTYLEDQEIARVCDVLTQY